MTAQEVVDQMNMDLQKDLIGRKNKIEFRALRAWQYTAISMIYVLLILAVIFKEIHG